MTRRRKNWRVRLAFEPNRYAQEQLQKTYEQISPIEARATAQPSDTRPAAAKQATLKRGAR
ncbi:hypothetical protein SAMN04515620_108148 [Collimonas sp. OK607]|uniref:hypothetical protein n=1 Tax=Collimonas sp. OK607 TaxID=1798194 RepID=UPI0008E8306D|nr:hypothetical protein [Collimonas sp. OK607]SFA93549.1 hypothetical protein SAMN04515620_108148 [Collimonas sp. OK607]